MWVWVDRLGVLLLDAGVSAVVLWAVAALAVLVSRQPARRLRIARAATVGSLAFLPLNGLDLVPQYDIFVYLDRVGVFSHPMAGRIASQFGREAAWYRATASAAWLPVLALPVRLFTVFYAAAVVGGLGWLALGYVAVGRVVACSRPPSAEALALLGRLPYSRRGRRPGLRVSSRVGRPVLVGLIRPLVLIPEWLDRPGAEDRLRLSLLHEFAHAEARDPGYTFLVNLARAVWFYLPLLWWVASRMTLDQEFLADRRAAERYGPVPAYASSLLEIAGEPFATSGPGPVGGVDGEPGLGRSPLFQRFLMLLRCPFPVEPIPPAWWSLGLLWVAFLVVLAVSTLTVRLRHSQDVGASRGHTFEMPRLEIAPTAAEPSGRCPPLELPVALPGRFDLTVEVWGDVPTLVRTRLAGLPLGPPGSSPPPPRPAGWHVVRLLRDPAGTRLLIDGRAAPIAPASPPLTEWLSVEPAPDRTVCLQRLVMTW